MITSFAYKIEGAEPGPGVRRRRTSTVLHPLYTLYPLIYLVQYLVYLIYLVQYLVYLIYLV